MRSGGHLLLPSGLLRPARPCPAEELTPSGANDLTVITDYANEGDERYDWIIQSGFTEARARLRNLNAGVRRECVHRTKGLERVTLD